MKTLNEKIVEISQHLQTLSSPKYSLDIKEAAEKNDKNLLIKACRKAKIPKEYIGNIASLILSVEPKKWPIEY